MPTRTRKLGHVSCGPQHRTVWTPHPGALGGGCQPNLGSHVLLNTVRLTGLYKYREQSAKAFFHE